MSNLDRKDKPAVIAYQENIQNYYKQNKLMYGKMVEDSILHATIGYITGSKLMGQNYQNSLQDFSLNVKLPYMGTSLNKHRLQIDLGANTKYLDYIKQIQSILRLSTIKHEPHMTIIEEVKDLPPEEMIINSGLDKLNFNGIAVTVLPIKS